ncbi:carbohydrate sulfotransferase 11-like isoform X1 [Bufo gargarizans]|uniref:carbohydrate sulfotransferase 11-like isoform X1 n=1 Tax=Bufo gargarizans TaxID=30331 RepID=UPI001CF5EDCD|nr:carbohydrate sulfotransferase 11-like isoform X1 [Bufo gargarizans]
MKFSIRFSILLVVLGIIYFWMKMVMMAQRRQVMTGQTAGLREEPRRTSVTLDSFLHVQQLRKRQLRHFCNRFPHLRALTASGSAEHLLSSMTVSHKLMTLYCKPADVTIDGWEELVQAAERRSDVTLRNPLPVDDNDTVPDQLAKYNPTMLAKMLRTYSKVLFVVDPYERLITTYMQGNAGEVSFEEFIEDILSTEASEEGISSSSVISLCYPCFVRYDYIVLLDFLQVELPHLLRRIGLPESVKPPPPIDRKIKMTSKWLLENLLRGLDQEQLEQLSKLYSWDFAAFPLVGNRTMHQIVSQS